MAVTIQIQVGDPGLGHWPVFGGLPYLLAQGVVFYRGSLVDAVVHFLEVMLKPSEIQPVQIKAQRLAAEGYPVHVVLTVAAVLRGPRMTLRMPRGKSWTSSRASVVPMPLSSNQPD